MAAWRGLADTDPLVRLAALRTLRPYPVAQVWPESPAEGSSGQVVTVGGQALNALMQGFQNTGPPDCTPEASLRLLPAVLFPTAPHRGGAAPQKPHAAAIPPGR